VCGSCLRFQLGMHVWHVPPLKAGLLTARYLQLYKYALWRFISGFWQKVAALVGPQRPGGYPSRVELHRWPEIVYVILVYAVQM
jgi:hypothetical protein